MTKQQRSIICVLTALLFTSACTSKVAQVQQRATMLALTATTEIEIFIDAPPSALEDAVATYIPALSDTAPPVAAEVSTLVQSVVTDTNGAPIVEVGLETEPLTPGVAVNEIAFFTPNNGIYSVGLRYGEYIITMSKVGYTPQSQRINVIPSDRLIIVNFVLQANGVPTPSPYVP